MSGQEVAVFIFLAVVIASMAYCTFGGLYRSAKDKRWGWFWAIIITWIAGLGWLFGGIYLVVGKRKSPRTVAFSKDKRSETPQGSARRWKFSKDNREWELRCSGCFEVVEESDKFCLKCKKSFEDPSCPNPDCEANPRKGARFCQECGTALEV